MKGLKVYVLIGAIAALFLLPGCVGLQAKKSEPSACDVELKTVDLAQLSFHIFKFWLYGQKWVDAKGDDHWLKINPDPNHFIKQAQMIGKVVRGRMSVDMVAFQIRGSWYYMTWGTVEKKITCNEMENAPDAPPKVKKRVRKYRFYPGGIIDTRLITEQKQC